MERKRMRDQLSDFGKEAVTCTVCLEELTDSVDRSWVKLQCCHQFHLDCIGSAFNAKRAMQCPNCRRSERGKWLFANGSRPMREFGMDDLAHDEHLYYLSSSEMAEVNSFRSRMLEIERSNAIHEERIGGLERRLEEHMKEYELYMKFVKELTEEWEKVKERIKEEREKGNEYIKECAEEKVRQLKPTLHPHLGQPRNIAGPLADSDQSGAEGDIGGGNGLND